MPAIGSGGVTVNAKVAAGSTFYDYRGQEYPVSYDIPVGTDAADVDAFLDLVGNSSNAYERKRRQGAKEEVRKSDPGIEVYDEAEASVNVVAKMKWVQLDDPEKTFVVEIPAPDAGMFTPDRQQVSLETGTRGALIKAAVETNILGVDWGYEGSWITTNATRSRPAHIVPTLEEPGATDNPGGAPALPPGD